MDGVLRCWPHINFQIKIYDSFPDPPATGSAGVASFKKPREASSRMQLESSNANRDTTSKRRPGPKIKGRVKHLLQISPAERTCLKFGKNEGHRGIFLVLPLLRGRACCGAERKTGYRSHPTGSHLQPPISWGCCIASWIHLNSQVGRPSCSDSKTSTLPSGTKPFGPNGHPLHDLEPINQRIAFEIVSTCRDMLGNWLLHTT